MEISLYTFFNFIHIVTAICWIGCVFALGILNLRLSCHKEGSIQLALIDQSRFFSKSIIKPAAILTLITGIVMVAVAGMTTTFWIIWGVIAAALSMAVGSFITNNVGPKLQNLMHDEKPERDELQKIHKQLFLLNSINILILLSAVWVMVFKPV